MSWIIEETKLDRDQKDFINKEVKQPGHIWVKGFAGSGKSVLLVHALKDIIKDKPNARVVIVVFTHSLIDMFKTGMKELGMPSNIPVMTYYEFVGNNIPSYDYIFCDEVQDLPARVLISMQNRVGNVNGKLIVAGDSNQSIYKKDPQWDEDIVKPEEISRIINIRPYDLNTIYRLTKSIISAISKLIPGMEIWKAKNDVTKQDVQIRIYEAESTDEEVNYVLTEAQKGPNLNQSSAILLPTSKEIISFTKVLLRLNGKPEWIFKASKWDVTKPREKQTPDYSDLNRHLKENNFKMECIIGKDSGSLENSVKEKNVIIMTYDSSKGLDFDNVFLPFVNQYLGYGRNFDKVLFMVAMSRSKLNLYLTYVGYTHDYVDFFKNGKNEFGVPINDCKRISDLGSSQGPAKSKNNNFDY